MPPFLRWSFLLALLPVASLAQTTPRLYVGASVVLLRKAPFQPSAGTHAGPAVTIGMQFNGRWAVETGFQSIWFTTPYYSSYMGSGGVDIYTSSVHSTYFIVPLLARFTVSPAGTPLRVDILSGAGWLHSSFASTHDNLLSGVPEHFEANGYANSVYATLGPQVRYILGAGFEAKLNAPVNAWLNSGDILLSNRLFFTPQLGLQYTFH